MEQIVKEYMAKREKSVQRLVEKAKAESKTYGEAIEKVKSLYFRHGANNKDFLDVTIEALKKEMGNLAILDHPND